jgi:hypothetical protein
MTVYVPIEKLYGISDSNLGQQSANVAGSPIGSQSENQLIFIEVANNTFLIKESVHAGYGC